MKVVRRSPDSDSLRGSWPKVALFLVMPVLIFDLGVLRKLKKGDNHRLSSTKILGRLVVRTAMKVSRIGRSDRV